jgi:hypothetical protein
VAGAASFDAVGEGAWDVARELLTLRELQGGAKVGRAGVRAAWCIQPGPR